MQQPKIRLAALDAWRGLIMVLMALDHARAFITRDQSRCSTRRQLGMLASKLGNPRSRYGVCSDPALAVPGAPVLGEPVRVCAAATVVGR